MKSYTITVNGVSYDVTVEEKNSLNQQPVRQAPVTSRPAAPAKQAQEKAVVTKPVSEGDVKIEAKAAGKVFKIEAAAGTFVKAGDTVLVLEVMKMETPVVAPEDGTIASILVSVGDAVESGVILATLNR